MPPPIQLADYAGTVVFAVSGGLAAAQRRLDITGFVLLALATAVGGGTIRDLLLAREVFWIAHPIYLVLAAVPGIVVFFIADRLQRLEHALTWADAAGLAVFTVIGTDIALSHGASPLIAMLMGVLTASGGGLIRDVLRNQLPLILHRELYAIAALAGAAVMVGLARAGARIELAAAAGLIVAFAMRAAGILWHIHLPVFTARRGAS